MSAIARHEDILNPLSGSAVMGGGGGMGASLRLTPALAETTGDEDASLQDFQGHLAKRIGAQRYDLWFDRKTRLWLDGETLCVEAANTFAANWIRSRFTADLEGAGREAWHRAVKVEVRVAAATPCAAEPPATLPRHAHLAGPSAAPSRNTHRDISHGPAGLATLDPRHTLEEFVVGPANQMAYHAALQVAQNPGRQFNPLFLHGHCGLGKTHLLQGICHRFARLHPTKRWLYLTGESFTNDFLDALKTHRTDAFRRRLRNADLLVIDDIHFLANKKATQEEFLHTFNQIDASGKQIVLASDCAPRQIQALSEQLSSRFVSGMVLRVDAPDLPTRLEILRRRVARNQWSVSETVLMHVAQSAASSVRELEGMLLQVVAGIQLIKATGHETTGGGPTVAALIKDRTALAQPIAVERIVAVVAEHLGLRPATLLGSGREKIVCNGRALAMYLARRHTGMSFPEIGRAMGNKNHSTVIAACQRVDAFLSSGELIGWNLPDGGRRHQAAADLLHDLEAQIRRNR